MSQASLSYENILTRYNLSMGDLIGFEGYLNVSTPFNRHEHNTIWKSDRRYHDFAPSDKWLPECDYPRFWTAAGEPYTHLSDSLGPGCRDSDFDQYGDVAAFGDYTEWQRQLSKFAFVQDRLREWKPSVRQKIERFACIMINQLDIDGYRIDKALQVTIDAQGAWSDSVRQCARKVGKSNFYIPGEIVAGNSEGAIYLGRGKQPNQEIANITQAVTTTNESDPSLFIRDPSQSALDGAAFHYTVYRALTRFLGMDGTFEAEGDPPVNFVQNWNAMLTTNDLVNANTGKFDPRHMYGVTNQDVFRWPGIKNGTMKQLSGHFVTSLVYPGIPTLFTGEEQAYYTLENTDSNYVFGRYVSNSSSCLSAHLT